MIDAVEVDLGRVQAISDGMDRKISVVLPARKALLLRRGYNLPVVDKGRRAIMVKCGDPEEAH